MKRNPWLIVTLSEAVLNSFVWSAVPLAFFQTGSREPLAARDSSMFLYVIKLSMTEF